MKHLVDRVVSANDFDVSDHPGCKVEILPGTAKVLGMVHHSDPVFLVHGHLDVVGIRPEVEAKPQLFKGDKKTTNDFEQKMGK